MTTEVKQQTPLRGTGVLLGAALGSVVPAVFLAALGAYAEGAPAAYGAAVGGLLVLAILCFGVFAVHVVSHLMPAFALVFALLTYALQIGLVLVALLALERSTLLDGTLDRGWLGVAAITAVLAWSLVQLVLATRQRIPAYDLPLDAVARQSEAGAR
jgi:hypothetical protein